MSTVHPEEAATSGVQIEHGAFGWRAVAVRPGSETRLTLADGDTCEAMMERLEAAGAALTTRVDLDDEVLGRPDVPPVALFDHDHGCALGDSQGAVLVVGGTAHVDPCGCVHVDQLLILGDHHGTEPGDGDDAAFGAEHGQGAADRVAAHFELLAQVTLGREHAAGSEGAAGDAGPQFIGDLPVDGSVAAGIDHAHKGLGAETPTHLRP